MAAKALYPVLQRPANICCMDQVCPPSSNSAATSSMCGQDEAATTQRGSPLLSEVQQTQARGSNCLLTAHQHKLPHGACSYMHACGRNARLISAGAGAGVFPACYSVRFWAKALQTTGLCCSLASVVKRCQITVARCSHGSSMDLLEDFNTVRTTFADLSTSAERFDNGATDEGHKDRGGSAGPSVSYDGPALSVDVTVRQAAR
jgi:hypothetical protein